MPVMRATVFNRAYLKQNAKNSLRRNLLYCVGISLIFSLVTSGWFGVEINADTGENFFRLGLGTIGSFEWTIKLDILTIQIGMAAAAIIGLLTILYSILVSGPMMVGLNRYYLENREAPSHLEALFYAFQSKHYFNIVKVMFLKELYSILWTLLFIIPGIVKAVEYSVIPAILAENPDMDYEEVFGIARSLTYGYKWDMFVLSLSFIGWSLLAVFTFGIGNLFLIPYIQATDVECYIYLRDAALAEGILKTDDVIDVEVKEEEKDVE